MLGYYTLLALSEGFLVTKMIKQKDLLPKGFPLTQLLVGSTISNVQRTHPPVLSVSGRVSVIGFISI